MQHPRVSLAAAPTPLQPLDRLGAELGLATGQLWVKRDDVTALAGGGNKARKLEFLAAEALADGCDVLVTGGAAQSNHVRMTAAAARQLDLGCVAVLGGPPVEDYDANLLLDRVFGVEIVWVGAYEAEDIERLLAETCVRLSAEGARPYEIPLGGATPVGSLGYVVAADELAAEARRGAVVYTASGSGGTQAGLVAGFGSYDRVRGVDVGAVPDLGARIKSLAAATASHAGRAMPSGELHLDDSQIGKGYGAHTASCREAVDLAARLEGLILDPVYTGKAMAALIADARAGRVPDGEPVVFLHTGGLPSVFADRHRDWLTS